MWALGFTKSCCLCDNSDLTVTMRVITALSFPTGPARDQGPSAACLLVVNAAHGLSLLKGEDEQQPPKPLSQQAFHSALLCIIGFR